MSAPPPKSAGPSEEAAENPSGSPAAASGPAGSSAAASGPAGSSAAACGPAAEHLRELALADERERAFAGAPKLALFNGIGFATVACLSLVFALFDTTMLVSALVLGAFAYFELRGRRLWLAYDARAPRELCWNQIAFCVVIVLYAVTRAWLSQSGPNPFVTLAADQPDLAALLEDSPEMGEMLHGAQSMYRIAIAAFYGLVALVTLLFQGGSAIYYQRRGRAFTEFLAATPSWVLEHKQRSRR